MTPIPASQVLDALQWRYAVKSFDPAKKIPAETWAPLEESLVLTPSSYGLQPWKFFILTDPALRESLVAHAWRQRQIVDCSHLVVMAVKTKMDEAEIDRFFNRMIEVRGGTADALAGYKKLLLRELVHDGRGEAATEWAARQAYIALGQFMTACALVGVDTCPMEGFVPTKFDELLGLEKAGLTSVVLCPAGYRADHDRYAHLPKVRYLQEHIIEHR